MVVKTLMRTRVARVTDDATLGDVRELSSVEREGGVAVVRDGRLVGLLTDRELQRAAPSTLPALARYESPVLGDRVPIRELVASSPATLTPETSVREAASLAATLGTGSLPVVEGDSLVGVVSTRDLLGVLVSELQRRAPAGPATILAPVEPDGTAAGVLATAIGLARRYQAAVRLLRVLPPSRRLGGFGSMWMEVFGLIAARRRGDAVEELWGSLPTVGDVEVTCAVVIGSPVVEIVRAAERLGADLVVMGGSRLAEGVLGRAPCPVLVVPAEGRAAHACP